MIAKKKLLPVKDMNYFLHINKHREELHRQTAHSDVECAIRELPLLLGILFVTQLLLRTLYLQYSVMKMNTRLKAFCILNVFFTMEQ